METSDESTKLLSGGTSLLITLGLIPLIFKSAIEKFAAALFVFFGSDYNADDIIILDGRPGRIVRVGVTKTTFYLYEVVNGQVVGGTKLVVQNEKLSDLNIEKPLGKIDIPATIKKD